MKEQTIYVSDDGRRFETREEYLQYEADVAAAQKFIATQIATQARGKNQTDARKAALKLIEEKYGSWSIYDDTTVIAGGIKHTIPQGQEWESAFDGRAVGPRGGRYWLTRTGRKDYSL
jgi:hypothetical protein